MKLLRTLGLIVVIAAFLGGLSPKVTTAALALAPKAAKRVAYPRDDLRAEMVSVRRIQADQSQARTVLAELAARYRYLDGVTVTVAPTPAGEQAIAYYTDGQIVIDPGHRAGIREILAHEVWHVIDWRDNGRLDWAEDLPPRDSSGYLSKKLPIRSMPG